MNNPRRQRGLLLPQILTSMAYGFVAVTAFACLLVVGMNATRPDRNTHAAFVTSTNAAVETAQLYAASSATANKIAGTTASASATQTDPLGIKLNSSLSASTSNNLLYVTSTVNGHPATIHVPIEPKAADSGATTTTAH